VNQFDEIFAALNGGYLMTNDRDRAVVPGWPEGAAWVREGFRDAARFRLRLSLRATPAERLQDLDAMVEFAANAEALNPHLQLIARRLREAKR
jgi:hypothetical protein